MYAAWSWDWYPETHLSITLTPYISSNSGQWCLDRFLQRSSEFISSLHFSDLLLFEPFSRCNGFLSELLGCTKCFSSRNREVLIDDGVGVLVEMLSFINVLSKLALSSWVIFGNVSCPLFIRLDDVTYTMYKMAQSYNEEEENENV